MFWLLKYLSLGEKNYIISIIFNIMGCFIKLNIVVVLKYLSRVLWFLI